MSTAAGWLAAIVPDIVAAQAEAEAHAAACTARPCERCDRYTCSRCGAPVEGRRTCATCQDAADDGARLDATYRTVPPRFRWALSADAQALAARVQAHPVVVRRGLEAPPSSSLLFTGRTGAGKTSLAVAMLGAWMRADRSRHGALYVEASVLARSRARHRLGDGEPPLMAAALSAPLVLLDDLGQEREDRDGCLTDLVYRRTDAELPTWITCGLPGDDVPAIAEQLARRYDGGFVRRVLEMGRRVALGGRS